MQPLDDIGDALRPEAAAEVHDWRLGRFVRTLWRAVFVVVGILAASGLLDLLGALD